MPKDTETIIRASARLEDLLIAGKEIARLMRTNPRIVHNQRNDDYAYAMMYWLRREIGYITRELGEGVPNAEQMSLVGQYLARNPIHPIARESEDPKE